MESVSEEEDERTTWRRLLLRHCRAGGICRRMSRRDVGATLHGYGFISLSLYIHISVCSEPRISSPLLRFPARLRKREEEGNMAGLAL
ncbi:hypothetical protein GDO78_020462 [Eleutherodactylus coqui]|uniref:Uncharacterized protein n=1 Tax=Eleutherodactylus coqui TaxID=57060 RepID=A0A8J6E2X7_ELECQ|nr:hypothetical protein GDO78_020462 [Eleutherodactylus coqui]